MLRALFLLLSSVVLQGCYYMQAASGQWQVLRKREPLQQVLDDPGTSPEVARRLRVLQEARAFSVAELGLPDNGSYRSYADLSRDYVVWNVFAVPEFSLEPKTWCFPVAGCVSYRGYFSEDDALAKASRLAEQGYDVAVGGIAAYSTLGRFDDPILSTMMRWSDVDLVATLFHELAHQVAYVKDDSTFNESFASAVEEFGIERWVAARGQQSSFDDYREQRAFRKRLADLMNDARAALQGIYESGQSAAIMRRQKRARLDQLAADIAVEFERAGRQPGDWYGGELNNAHLVSTSLYRGRLPAFRGIFEQCEQRFDCFYQHVRALAGMSKAQRDKALASRELLGL